MVGKAREGEITEHTPLPEAELHLKSEVKEGETEVGNGLVMTGIISPRGF